MHLEALHKYISTDHPGPQHASDMSTFLRNSTIKFHSDEVSFSSSRSEAVRSSFLQVQARFVERFSLGANGEAGNTFMGLTDKVSWVEKFLRVGAQGMEAAQDEHDRCILAAL